MNNREAKRQARENKRTWGELKEALHGEEPTSYPSAVNDVFTKREVLDILKEAVMEFHDDEYPKDREIVIVKNILRECL